MVSVIFPSSVMGISVNQRDLRAGKEYRSVGGVLDFGWYVHLLLCLLSNAELLPCPCLKI